MRRQSLSSHSRWGSDITELPPLSSVKSPKINCFNQSPLCRNYLSPEDEKCLLFVARTAAAPGVRASPSNLAPNAMLSSIVIGVAKPRIGRAIKKCANPAWNKGLLNPTLEDPPLFLHRMQTMSGKKLPCVLN